MQVLVKKIYPDSILPKCMTDLSAGYDLHAYTEDISIGVGETILVSTGLMLALPKGTFGMICPRSGLSANHGITILNSPGIVDADYRGEVRIILHNAGKKAFAVTKGMRIAQLLFMSHAEMSMKEVHDLDQTARGRGGFGSTGVY